MKVGDRIKRTKIIPIRLVQENHDTDWDGVPNYRDCQPLNPWKQDVDENIKVYPNATIGEVRKNVKEVDVGVPFYEGQRASTYKKGNFGYLIDERGDAKSIYLPSMKKPLKIMFEWNSKKKKWIKGTWREGEW